MLLPLTALLAFAVVACGDDEPTQVAAVVDTDGPTVDGTLPTSVTEVGDVGEVAGGAVESPPTTVPPTTAPRETPPSTTVGEVFVPVGEAVYHPAVTAFCDRIAVFAVTVGTMGPDFDAAELAAIEASAEDLTDAATDVGFATIDTPSLQRLTECTNELQRSLGDRLGD